MGKAQKSEMRKAQKSEMRKAQTLEMGKPPKLEMEKAQTSEMNTTAKRRGKWRRASNTDFCIVCRKRYPKHAANKHMHGERHHRELETVLGKDFSHECYACKESSMDLTNYIQHISTAQHEANFTILMSKNVKARCLFKTLGAEAIEQILQRNRMLRNEEKTRKKEKKMKQRAGKKLAEKQILLKNMKLPKVPKTAESSTQVDAKTPKQMHQTHLKGSNNAVVQNKENKVFTLQRRGHQRETALQNQSRQLAGLAGEPARTWHQACVRDQFTHTAHQICRNDVFSVNNQSVSVGQSRTGGLVKRPCNVQEGSTTDMAKYITWPATNQCDYDKREYNSAQDFTTDHLPEGAIIFDQVQDEPTGSSLPGQEGSHRSPYPALANTPGSAVRMQDVDIRKMLWQVRRTLGVREPCRADREAKQQNGVEGAWVARSSTAQKTRTESPKPSGGGTTSVQSLQANTSVHVAHSHACPSSTAPTKSKQSGHTWTKGTTQHSDKRSADADGPSNTREKESQWALDSTTSFGSRARKTTSTEPNPINHKVRIAYKSSILNKLITLSGARCRQSWEEMYWEMKRKKLNRFKSMPRFVKPVIDQESSSQPRDDDLPLSEGFHWESVHRPSVPHLTLPPPPPPQDRMHTDQHREVQPDCQVVEPCTTQQSESSHTETAASVKAEPNLEDENRGFRNDSSANKRKYNTITETEDGASDKEKSGEKKKTKLNKDQAEMKQLLAVSLREDELSHSLQDLDKSLIQTRNALQAAYTEVQRLLLLRQKFTAEVNSLRAKRIGILQGMQEGYCGASHAAEKATASPATAATTLQLRHSPLPSSSAFTTSSSQQTPATPSASAVTQPHQTPYILSAVSLMQEICHPPTAGPASQFVSHTEAPLNQTVPLFPAELLPPLMLTPSHLAAPQTAVKDCANTEQQEPLAIDSNSEEETGRVLGQPDQVKGRESVPNMGQTASAAAPDADGNQSDDSVKMVEPPKVVINIDESDEDSNVPAQPEPPHKSVSVEFSCSSAQAFQQTVEDRKVQISSPVKDANISVESAEKEEPTLGVFVKHMGPVHGLQVHEGLLYTCSGDNTARAYSLVSRECQAVFEGHTNIVNCLLVASLPNMPARLYTGSSDETIRCYSIKSKKCLELISLVDRVLCLHIAWNILYAGLANGSVTSYDLKTLKQLDTFECHGPRGVSCLGTTQEGTRRVLLVGSYDSTISVRDAKNSLLLRSLKTHTKTVLCMKVVNDLVFSGSSDTSVHAHNIHTGELLRVYKGHGLAVTSIVIVGNVMVTACLDRLVRVYDLQSHDCLQVYGGHNDMVMCMAIHKSVIYTGCYDGNVQAVKLNLMKNYRCWWQNCSLIFGLAEHLMHHLVQDHTNPSLQTVKCRWRDCHSFFATQQLVQQKLPGHMQNHVENDSLVQP